MQALYAIIKAFEFVYHETMTPIHIGLRFSVIMYISDSYVDSKKKKKISDSYAFQHLCFLFDFFRYHAFTSGSTS